MNESYIVDESTYFAAARERRSPQENFVDDESPRCQMHEICARKQLLENVLNMRSPKVQLCKPCLLDLGYLADRTTKSLEHQIESYEMTILKLQSTESHKDALNHHLVEGVLKDLDTELCETFSECRELTRQLFSNSAELLSIEKQIQNETEIISSLQYNINSIEDKIEVAFNTSISTAQELNYYQHGKQTSLEPLFQIDQLATENNSRHSKYKYFINGSRISCGLMLDCDHQQVELLEWSRSWSNLCDLINCARNRLGLGSTVFLSVARSKDQVQCSYANIHGMSRGYTLELHPMHDRTLVTVCGQFSKLSTSATMQIASTLDIEVIEAFKVMSLHVKRNKPAQLRDGQGQGQEQEQTHVNRVVACVVAIAAFIAGTALELESAEQHYNEEEIPSSASVALLSGRMRALHHAIITGQFALGESNFNLAKSVTEHNMSAEDDEVNDIDYAFQHDEGEDDNGWSLTNSDTIDLIECSKPMIATSGKSSHFLESNMAATATERSERVNEIVGDDDEPIASFSSGFNITCEQDLEDLVDDMMNCVQIIISMM